METDARMVGNARERAPVLPDRGLDVAGTEQRTAEPDLRLDVIRLRLDEAPQFVE